MSSGLAVTTLLILTFVLKETAPGAGDGDGVVNPEEPEVMVFDDVSVQELPQSCCISWLLPLLEKSLVNL
jgi:hypothetical protein